jgi:hypothetical protein
LSAADTRIRLPHFDQQILVMGEEHSSSRSSLAMPLVSKSQITQLPSLHPADSVVQIKHQKWECWQCIIPAMNNS